jgi:phage-related protein
VIVKQEPANPKPCFFLGSSRKDLRALPAKVRVSIGHAIFEAQCGGEAPSAKAMRGFGGRGVLEIVEDFDGDTYRGIYTVRFVGAIYVLHVFQKKSKRGIAAPGTEIELIKTRLRTAQAHHTARLTEEGPKQ